MKYKQKVIPSVKTPDFLKNLTAFQLRKYAKEVYKKKLQGSIVQNEHLGHTITLSAQGKNKISQGSSIYSSKVAVLGILKDIIKHAEYSNWGKPKLKDPKELMGYLNFKCKVKIDGKLEHLRFSVMMFKDGKIYYGHEINKAQFAKVF